MSRLVVSTDGHVGEAGAAWAFVAEGEDEPITRAGLLEGPPSHLAEWRAALEALRFVEDRLNRGDELELRTDSALVAKGLASRRPAMSGEAAEARAECRQRLARLAKAGVRIRVLRVRREENAVADSLARQAVESTRVSS